MSKEFPSQFGNAPQYRNPSGTIPMPQPKDIPAASWTQTRYRLDWGTPFAVAPNQANFFPEGWLWTVNWSSPFFDMRPDLRSSQGQVKEGVPMWRMGARLYVELIGQLLAPLGVQYGATSNDVLPCHTRRNCCPRGVLTSRRCCWWRRGVSSALLATQYDFHSIPNRTQPIATSTCLNRSKLFAA